MKRLALILLTAILLFLPACSRQSSPEEAPTLWVLTEESTSDGMNLQANLIAQSMQEKYPDLTITIEILPTDPQTRKLYIDQLHAEVMAGRGPDIYLLPTNSTLTLGDLQETVNKDLAATDLTPFFDDVALAMRSGLFADLEPYYSADTDLNTAALNQIVMDAGVLDSSRYVLPLRYTIPVLFADLSRFEEYGIPASALSSDIFTLTQALLSAENSQISAPGLRLSTDLSIFPDLFNYETGELLLTTEDLANYMRLYQQWNTLASTGTPELITTAVNHAKAIITSQEPDFFENVIVVGGRELYDYDMDSLNSIVNYICDDVHWTTFGLPIFATDLAGTLQTAAISKAMHKDLPMYPLRSADGSLIAEVTYYGAVGGGCDTPELAYEFLRAFLTEEYQWDIYRPRIDKSYALRDTRRRSEVQTRGLVEDSWPVRSTGSAVYLWDNTHYQMEDIYSSWYSLSISRTRAIQNMQIITSDADLPALSWPIDTVRFPITQSAEESFSQILSQLNNPDGTPTNVDIDQLAQQYHQTLWWHLAEG